MRILIVTNTYPPADITGVGALAVELASVLGGAGHEVRVLTRTAPPGDPHAVAIGGPKLLFPLLAAWRFLRERPYDVIHVHESDGAFVVLLARLARLLRRRRGAARIVATLQVSYLHEMRVVRPVLADGVVVSVPSQSEQVFAWLRAPLHLLLGRLTARLSDAVTAPSEQTARELRADYGAEIEAVIPNGLDAAAIGVASAHPFDDVPRPLVLYAGRLRTRKAVAVLVQAFAVVAATQRGVCLALVGDGEQRAALEAQVANLGLGERVRFVGAVPRAEIGRWYASADVFCLPSTYEGFPVAILEAMAYGLPVVSTRVAGIPEAVIDGETGYIVEPEAAVDLAERLLRLLGDEPLREKMGEAARRRFDELYRSETVAHAYMELFTRLGENPVGGGVPRS